MKILITGSHFTPAQAVIEELQKDSSLEIIYIGRKHTLEGDKTLSVESGVLPKLGIKFIPLTTGRLRRTLDLLTLWSLFKIPFGFLQAFWILLKEDPDVILSFGGYVGVPVVIGGWLLSKKIIVHEQTLVSGLANKISSIFADKIAVSFKKEYEFNSSKIVLTGNPIRRELMEGQKLTKETEEIFRLSKKEKLPVIFITGGNQGAHSINRVVLEVLEELTKLSFVIHQTGDSKYQDFEELTKKQPTLSNPNHYLAKKWISGDMGGILKRADLVISRSGANTLTELAYFGVPTLVIPLPGLYKNEQMVNARFFEKEGLARVLPQNELTPKRLIEEIKTMLVGGKSQNAQAKKASSLVIRDGAKRLALETVILGSDD